MCYLNDKIDNSNELRPVSPDLAEAFGSVEHANYLRANTWTTVLTTIIVFDDDTVTLCSGENWENTIRAGNSVINNVENGF